MSFQLTQCVFVNVSCTVADGFRLESFLNAMNIEDNEPGGTFTMGAFDSLGAVWLADVP